MRHAFRAASVWVIAFTSTSMSAYGASLVNGDFETPTVPTGSYQTFNNGTDVGGWTAIGGQVAIVNTLFTQSGLSFAAQSGDQWLDLTGLSANSAEGVQQSVTTTPGADYALSFWVGNVVNPGGSFGTNSTVHVLIDGVQVASETNSGGSGSSTQNWMQFSVPFTAAGATTTIAFVNADPSSDNSNGLDNVELALSETAVPLPAAAWSALSVLVGLAGVGGWRAIGRRIA